jgi:cytochrome c oxidase assembly protein subunit 15
MRGDATLPVEQPVEDDAYALRLAGAFGALVVLTFGLVTLGALVRAHGAGLACPDWPLCFGELVPRMNLRVAFEWTHRLVAGSLSVSFLGLAVLALRRSATREVCAAALGAAALLLGVQVLLGALTVWHLLASWTVTAHLLTGNAFAVALLWIALALRESALHAQPAAEPRPALRRAVGVAALLLGAQLLLGGLVASHYAGLACPEFPTCRDGRWLPGFEGAMGLQLLHRLGGLALLVALAVAARLARGAAPALRRSTAAALALALVQLCVGAANVLLGLPAEITGLHSALAAALVLTFSVAVRECWRAPGPGRRATKLA